MTGLVHGIGIGEEEPFSARGLGSGPDGIGFASPALLQRRSLHDHHAWKAVSDGVRLVGRVVVDNEDLPVAAELPCMLRLARERTKAVAEAVFFVAGGNND